LAPFWDDFELNQHFNGRVYYQVYYVIHCIASINEILGSDLDLVLVNI